MVSSPEQVQASHPICLLGRSEDEPLSAPDYRLFSSPQDTDVTDVGTTIL